MPHCIIEYAVEFNEQNNTKELVEIINKDIIASNLFDNSTIKTRAIPVSDYLVGGKQKLFIHITIKLLKGRSVSQKQLLGTKILKTISEKYNSINDISIEVIDINQDFYFKKVNH